MPIFLNPSGSLDQLPHFASPDVYKRQDPQRANVGAGQSHDEVLTLTGDLIDLIAIESTADGKEEPRNKQLVDVYKRQVLLLAPTGKAARRMSESTGEQAYTIHRGLGLTPREGEEDLIRSGHSMMSDETGFLCIDEGSMVDNVLMSAIVEKLPMGSRFLCIGDTDQLPSCLLYTSRCV